MNFLSNAHTHTTYCDGRSTIAEQLDSAQRLGFVSLGFSGHAMQGFDWKYCMSVENQASYLAELRALQASLAHSDQAPKLYAGLEQDAFVPDAEKQKNREQYDYLIGSTHYFPEPLNGAWVAVDGDPALLARCIDERFGGDPLAMAAAYYQIHGAYIAKDRPDVIGHFDLVRKYAARLNLDLESPAYRKAALDALATARTGCDLLEVNTGNIARGYEQVPYPAPFILDAWRELGGRLTLTSDCHEAAKLDCAFDSALALMKAHGFHEVWRLGAGAALWEPMEL